MGRAPPKKTHTRRNHNVGLSKQYPACWTCTKRRVKCSATTNNGAYPCTDCVKNGIAVTCISHLQHPNWVPGQSGSTRNTRNNPQAGQRYRNVISKHIKKQTKGRREESDDEDSDSDFTSPTTTSGPLRRSARAGRKPIDYAKLAGEDVEMGDESGLESVAEDESVEGDSVGEVGDETGSPDTSDDTPDVEMPDEATAETSGVYIGGYHWDFEPGFMDD